MDGVQIHNFDFNKLMEFVAETTGEVYMKTAEGDVLNLKSRLTQLLVLSGAMAQGSNRDGYLLELTGWTQGSQAS